MDGGPREEHLLFGGGMIGASRMFDAGGIPLFTSWSFLGALRSSCRQYIVPVITSNDLS